MNTASHTKIGQRNTYGQRVRYHCPRILLTFKERGFSSTGTRQELLRSLKGANAPSTGSSGGSSERRRLVRQPTPALLGNLPLLQPETSSKSAPAPTSTAKQKRKQPETDEAVPESPQKRQKKATPPAPSKKKGKAVPKSQQKAASGTPAKVTPKPAVEKGKADTKPQPEVVSRKKSAMKSKPKGKGKKGVHFKRYGTAANGSVEVLEFARTRNGSGGLGRDGACKPAQT